MPGTEKSRFTLFEPFEEVKGVPTRRWLQYDINALADFEQLTGMGFGQLMSTRAIFATTRALLWAGLKRSDTTLTVERVGTLMTRYVKAARGNSIDDLLTACFQAAKEQGAFGEAASDEEDEEEGGSDSGNDEEQEEQSAPTSPTATRRSGPRGSRKPSPSPTGSSSSTTSDSDD